MLCSDTLSGEHNKKRFRFVGILSLKENKIVKTNFGPFLYTFNYNCDSSTLLSTHMGGSVSLSVNTVTRECFKVQVKIITLLFYIPQYKFP